jgi:hypothetical protein
MYQKLCSDITNFRLDQHFLFSPLSDTWTLADVELKDDCATTPFAVSGIFPLFSVEGGY